MYCDDYDGFILDLTLQYGNTLDNNQATNIFNYIMEKLCECFCDDHQHSEAYKFDAVLRKQFVQSVLKDDLFCMMMQELIQTQHNNYAERMLTESNKTSFGLGI